MPDLIREAQFPTISDVKLKTNLLKGPHKIELLSYLLEAVLCPLSRDTTICPSSAWGGLFLFIPLIPLQTSIMVSLAGPREPEKRAFNGKY